MARLHRVPGGRLVPLGFPYQLDARDLVSTAGKKALPFAFGAIVAAATSGLDPEKWAQAMDKAAASTVVAVTDRRIITARTNALSQQGDVSQIIPIDRVRYVRAVTAKDENERSAIDLITRDDNIRWLFHADTDTAQVDALAGVLAESMRSRTQNAMSYWGDARLRCQMAWTIQAVDLAVSKSTRSVASRNLSRSLAVLAGPGPRPVPAETVNTHGNFRQAPSTSTAWC
jgi:hypothetical protein